MYSDRVKSSPCSYARSSRYIQVCLLVFLLGSGAGQDPHTFQVHTAAMTGSPPSYPQPIGAMTGSPPSYPQPIPSSDGAQLMHPALNSTPHVRMHTKLLRGSLPMHDHVHDDTLAKPNNTVKQTDSLVPLVPPVRYPSQPPEEYGEDDIHVTHLQFDDDGPRVYAINETHDDAPRTISHVTHVSIVHTLDDFSSQRSTIFFFPWGPGGPPYFCFP